VRLGRCASVPFLLAGAVFIACSQTTSDTAESAAACPAPAVERSTWSQAVFENRGFTFQVPPTYRKSEFEVQYGEPPPKVWQAGVLDRVSAFVDSGPADLDQAKGRRLPYHPEYSRS